MDQRAIARFRGNKGAIVGLVIVLSIVVFSFGVPLVMSGSPYVPDFEHGRGPFGTPGPPTRLHWLGTDSIFRDLLLRLAHGGRLSLEVAVAATFIAITIGTATGVLSGYFKGTRVRLDQIADVVACAAVVAGAVAFAMGAEDGGFRALGFAAWSVMLGGVLRVGSRIDALLGRERRARLAISDLLDTVFVVAALVSVVRRGSAALGDHRVAAAIALVGLASFALRLASRRTGELRFLRIDFDDLAMRIVDVLLSFPFLLLLMALSSAIDRTTVATIFLVLGLTAWTGTARVIRGKTLQIRELDFIVASRALGQSTPRILVRHVLPNVVGLAIVLATNSVAGMIVAEASLSFLGLSLPPPTASWGRMLDEGRQYYAMAPWLLLAPSLAILLAVLGFNLLGEGLRDVFDPKESR